ncbi:MAG: anaerobic ribonucleoside-triphosphate reductase activating protein [Anaerovoracaceae bacterium]|jgi:pyruvate formate lyase activating enzyme
MIIAGIVKSSLIDFPGRASTVIFLGGCNFRCGYCHNPDMVMCNRSGIRVTEVFDFLNRRKRFLDGVCISGGEPTIWPELYDFICGIKTEGLAVKLDTNGSNPHLLERLISENLLDYVAMDVKGPRAKYEKITRCKIAGGFEAIEKSSELLRRGSCPYEFRTTVARELLTEEDLKVMISQHPGAEQWYFQNYRDSGKRLDSVSEFTPYGEKELEDIGVRLCASVR